MAWGARWHLRYLPALHAAHAPLQQTKFSQLGKALYATVNLQSAQNIGHTQSVLSLCKVNYLIEPPCAGDNATVESEEPVERPDAGALLSNV